MSDAPVLVKQILEDAIHSMATDIHFCLEENQVSVHFRIIGIRKFHKFLTIEQYKILLSYYKYTGKLDIGETRIPQQGAVSIKIRKGEYALRISTLPSAKLESLAIRILPQEETLSIHELFLFRIQTNQIKKWLDERKGIILFTGPTGSGKTTSLYALIQSLKCEHNLQIITLEDPIEKRLHQTIQVPINQQTGLTYDAGLKASLRHDPDVIMVGEIRDHETAKFVVKAAYTGHLVLSTIHANNAIGTIYRLLDMGIKKIDIEQNIKFIASVQLLPIQVEKYPNKRAAILEMLNNTQISQILRDNSIPLTNFIEFNQLRRKAFAYGFLHNKFI